MHGGSHTMIMRMKSRFSDFQGRAFYVHMVRVGLALIQIRIVCPRGGFNKEGTRMWMQRLTS